VVDTDKGSATAEDDFDVFYQTWRTPIRRSLALASPRTVEVADQAQPAGLSTTTSVNTAAPISR
jgi:hypothetical protein